MAQKRFRTAPVPLERWKFGPGILDLSREDGSIVAIRHPKHPGMSFLLGDGEGHWHHEPRFWGKGFLIADGIAGRWNYPGKVRWGSGVLDANFDPVPGVSLRIRREVIGDRLLEIYSFQNETSKLIRIGSLGISTPFRDVYHKAKESLAHACHAHVNANGATAWVWALRMNGRGPGLGLMLKKGALWSYSIESRNITMWSHFRGHIYLHVTDFARAPHAFGGQPEIHLPGGEELQIEWELGWFDSFDELRSEVQSPVELDRLSAETGRALLFRCGKGVKLPTVADGLQRERTSEGFEVRTRKSGEYHIDVITPSGTMRIGVLFHRPVRDLVLRRIDYILQHQRAVDRDPSRRGALLPIDTTTQLRLEAGAWPDWSDGRERIGMPILMQGARRRGWGNKDALDEALHSFAAFARRHLVREDGLVVENSYVPNPHRLYNFPWFAEFFVNQYQIYGDRNDAELAARIMEAYYRRGGGKYLAFVDCIEAVIDSLNEGGDVRRGERLRRLFLKHVDYYLGIGTDLPSHEVNYEQSMVAPLVLLAVWAARLSGEDRYLDAAIRLLPWLEAFAGEQPHIRLRHVPIRHWDGFWFGRERLWGDVFPHYWTVLSAAAFGRIALARPKLAGRLRPRAEAIFAANLTAYFEDGSATCAFMYPSCIDGHPAYFADPLANDQDWSLAWLLKEEALGSVEFPK
jgi:hypothetical protein